MEVNNKTGQLMYDDAFGNQVPFYPKTLAENVYLDNDQDGNLDTNILSKIESLENGLENKIDMGYITSGEGANIINTGVYPINNEDQEIGWNFNRAALNLFDRWYDCGYLTSLEKIGNDALIIGSIPIHFSTYNRQNFAVSFEVVCRPTMPDEFYYQFDLDENERRECGYRIYYRNYLGYDVTYESDLIGNQLREIDDTINVVTYISCNRSDVTNYHMYIKPKAISTRMEDDMYSYNTFSVGGPSGGTNGHGCFHVIKLSNLKV